MSSKQNGSAHVVVIVLLVAALTGALGWIFYQNFVETKPTQETTIQTSEQVAKPSIAETKKVCLKVEKSCYTVPVSWSLDNQVIPSKDDFPKYDYASIKDGNGNTEIVVNSGISGVGGSCGNTDQTWSTKIVDHEETAVNHLLKYDVTDPGYLLKKINVVQAVFYDSQKGYAPYIYLTGDSMSIKDGYEGCFPSQLGMYNSQNVKQTTTFTGNYDGFGSGQESGSDGKQLTFYKNEAEAKKMLRSSDMEQIYKVLKSVSYNEE